MSLLLNSCADFGVMLDSADRKSIGREAPGQVLPYLKLWSDQTPTPLVSLERAAKHFGVAEIYLKDEGPRLGLGSFKALGGAYAVMRLVHGLIEKRIGGAVSISSLLSPSTRRIAGPITVCCATDGNHGRSVAAGAKLIGCRAVVFVHRGVSAARIEAMRLLDAEIVRVAGSYDDSVDEAAHVAKVNGWHVVSDTSWPGYEEIPALVAQGYTVLADEVLREMERRDTAPPTHVFLQAGVGGFAAAISGHFREVLGADMPAAIVVEPDRAACLFESMRQDRLVRISKSEPTLMAMLECYRPSLVAWRILRRCAAGFMTIGDDEAIIAMRALAQPLAGDVAVISGESGCAGYAGFVSAVSASDRRSALDLGPRSRVLLVNTETATDPEIYRSFVAPEAKLWASPPSLLDRPL